MRWSSLSFHSNLTISPTRKRFHPKEKEKKRSSLFISRKRKEKAAEDLKPLTVILVRGATDTSRIADQNAGEENPNRQRLSPSRLRHSPPSAPRITGTDKPLSPHLDSLLWLHYTTIIMPIIRLFLLYIIIHRKEEGREASWHDEGEESKSQEFIEDKEDNHHIPISMIGAGSRCSITVRNDYCPVTVSWEKRAFCCRCSRTNQENGDRKRQRWAPTGDRTHVGGRIGTVGFRRW